MFISLLVIILACAGGLAVTYVFADEETFLWRLSAGTVIGSGVFGTLTFAAASVLGLNALSIAIAMAATLLPLLLFRKRPYRRQLWLEWQRAKGKLQGAGRKTFFRFGYYVFFFVLFCYFFDRAMIETADGIFTGASHNLGDLPFHLGAIFGFTDGNNFPPVNPSFAGARFSYPFIADMVSAAAVRLGADVNSAMFTENVAWAMSLLVVLESFIKRLTGSRLAAKIGPSLLFFSGGIGFLWFITDFVQQNEGFFQFLWKLPRDYTLNDNFVWGNALITLFITQRSILLGMPLTIVVLSYLWRLFVSTDEDQIEAGGASALAAPFLVGMIAGLLPLIHLHSLAVLFVVGAFSALLKPARWKHWTAFAAGTAILAIPELVWSLSGSASRATEFVGWNFGWDAKETNIFLFWFRNTGIVLPLILFGVMLLYKRLRGKKDPERSKKNAERESLHPRDLLLFYLPFVLCFAIANMTKLAPWEWDNIKVLIYWFVGSIPIIAFSIAWLWQKKEYWWKAAAALCFGLLVVSGALDVWRTVSRQINMRVFDKDAVATAEQIKQKTPPNALFLNAPTYNSAVVLTGRRSLMRFPGHLWSHGIDYSERESDVKKMYAGGPTADELIRKYEIDYIILSPEERGSVAPNEDYFRKFPVVARAGQDTVYKVPNIEK
jgi:hypothetical protein